MGISEEELKTMLAEMGMDALADLEGDLGDFRPIPAGPVRRAVAPSLEVEAMPITEEPAPEPEVLLEPQVSLPNNSQHRELSVTTLLHLMGMPTGSQLTVMDTKLDLVLTKMATLQAKIDRINSQFETSGTERLELQVTEIRSIMKKFFPQAFSGGSPQTSAAKLGTVKPTVVVQSSKPSSAGLEAMVSERKETEVHIAVAPNEGNEDDEPISDEDYQVLEAQKLRAQVS